MNETLQPVLKQLVGSTRSKREKAFLKEFARRLYGKASTSFLSLFTHEELVALALSSLKFLQRRRKNETKIQVFNPSRRESWCPDATCIRILVRDRPFIFDSLRASLAAQGLEEEDFVHPILDLARDGSGQLIRQWGHEDASLEAYELFLVRQVDATRHKEIKERLAAVLKDVLLATGDYQPMRRKALAVGESLQALAAREDVGKILSESKSDVTEYAHFIDWLLADNFVFLGYREYELLKRRGHRYIQAKPGSGLGILRKEEQSSYASPTLLSKVPEGLRKRMLGGPALLVTKTNADSTVHRPVRMDYIGVKRYDEAGQAVGEMRILGLFTSKAHSMGVGSIPLLRRKLSQVQRLDESVSGSHDFKQIVSIFNSMPRDELFWSSPRALHKDIRTIMAIERQRGVRLTLRSDPLGRGMALMVIMPRDRFSTRVREEIQEFLAAELEATHADYQLAMGEDEAQVRLHFFFASSRDVGSVDLPRLDREVAELTRSWEDRLQEHLEPLSPASQARTLAERYAGAFEEGYRAEVPVLMAARDVQNLEALGSDAYRIDLADQALGSDGILTTQVRIYHQQSTLVLSDVFPILENLGLRVVEQISYSLDGHQILPLGSRNASLGIDIFRVLDRSGQPVDLSRSATVLSAALLELLSGRSIDDKLNHLVILAGLDVRQISLLRTYRAYLFQVQAATSLKFVTQTLLNHPASALAIFRFFEARFGPATAKHRQAAVERARSEFSSSLEAVVSLAEDETLRTIFQLVEATLRTNYFQDHPWISLKIESSRVPSMPDPRPLFEIFVKAPTVEGIHLRGGKVARGGLRWSDRPDDFRTEVLGLMKTQMTKNAVIVPVGSKGGFVLTDPPADREQLAEHVKEQYRTFVRGLLDLTDNIVGDKTVPPAGLVIYDEPDPYLVVAADKGTARFSDIANSISQEYEFWLADAFASGGSYGYDHKEEGITARGAWECVKRHFRELGLNLKLHSVTVAGIGDMSGDVFGNGLLYSDNLKLLAAFNHRHIFLDPDPDPKRSFRERKRLFRMRGSTWNDYKPELISAGGGVFARHAKSIPLSEPVRALLGVEADSLNGRGLVREILKMKVDLLWNGGIGTYVKATSERHSDVGDKSNDGVRVDATEVQARVVGEGGNLGFTQKARVEYALAGGAINTDAIDNSAGVDMSDHEVNIKILLQPGLQSGKLGLEARNRLLEGLTDDVSHLVLAHNYSQSSCLSMGCESSRRDMALFESLQEHLRDRGALDPVVEYLPDRRGYAQRASQGKGLTRPELAILLAYTKMALTEHLVRSEIPDQPFVEHYLHEYFPARLIEECRDDLPRHPLRREIIACRLTNLVVDKLGIAFIHGTLRDTGATAAEVVQAAVASAEALGLSVFLDRIDALDDRVDSAAQALATREVVRAAGGVVEWVLLGDVDLSSLADFVSSYREPLHRLRTGISKLLPPSERREYKALSKRFKEAGFPAKLAAEVAAWRYFASSMGLIEASHSQKVSLDEAARAFYEIGGHLYLGMQRDALFELPKETKWAKIAASGLIMELRNVQRDLTIEFFRAARGRELSVEEFLKRDLRVLERFQKVIRSPETDPKTALTKASVEARILARMVESARRLNSGG